MESIDRDFWSRFGRFAASNRINCLTWFWPEVNFYHHISLWRSIRCHCPWHLFTFLEVRDFVWEATYTYYRLCSSSSTSREMMRWVLNFSLSEFWITVFGFLLKVTLFFVYRRDNVEHRRRFISCELTRCQESYLHSSWAGCCWLSRCSSQVVSIGQESGSA